MCAVANAGIARAEPTTMLPATYVKSRTCWLQPLSAQPADVERDIAFQFWLQGLNHREVDGGLHPIDQPAPAAIVNAIRNDWSADSQIIAFTGVNDIDGCGSAKTADECVQRDFAAQAWTLDRSVPDPSWRAGAVPEQEFSVLSTPKWRVVDEGVIVTGTQESHVFNSGGIPWFGHENQGIDRVRVEGHMRDGRAVSFHLFITHLSWAGDIAKRELAKDLDEIAKHTAGDEYAPLLVGDFNGMRDDPRLGTWFALATDVDCKAGIGAGTRVHAEETTMTVFVGQARPGTPFEHMKGTLVPLRRSFNSRGSEITNPVGVKVPGVSHTLVGVAFRIAPRSPVPPECTAPADDFCPSENACFDLRLDAKHCGSCTYRCGPGASCSGGQCRTSSGGGGTPCKRGGCAVGLCQCPPPQPGRPGACVVDLADCP